MRPYRRQNQRAMVMDALLAGARTTAEVEAITNLPRKHCAAWLSIMRQDGVVRVTGKVRFYKVGRVAFEWRMT